MSEITITVRGEHEVRVAPEQAVIHLSVAYEGADRESTVERVLSLASPVREGLVARAESGAVVEWSSTRLSVRAERPWNDEGRRLAVVYTATVEFTATFADPSELSLWATEVAVWDGVAIGSTQWRLTPDTHANMEREVAAAAVGAALTRAVAYARALGRQDVEPVEIADTGLISATTPRNQQAFAMRAMTLADTGAAAMEFRPEDIVVSATVEGRFLAR